MILNIIEPTCNNYTGHCYGYLETVTRQEEKELSYHLWLGSDSQKLEFKNPSLKVHAFFRYKLRKLQVYFLYRKLIRQQQAIFVPTASALDIMMISLLSRRYAYRKTAIFHFHQFSKKPKKIAKLKKIAAVAPDSIVILVTTSALASIFRDIGFQKVKVVPCPVPTHSNSLRKKTDRTSPHLLYAGAARRDKGFQVAVALLALIAKRPQWQPRVKFQTSPSHANKLDSQMQQALQKLKTISYAKLEHTETSLSPQQYEEQFANAVTLLLYDVESYRDKFSGICLDSLLCGAPIVTVAGTWLGDTVVRFNAGVALPTLSLEKVYQAVKNIYDNYEAYRENALAASAVLAQEHDPKHTVNLLKRHCQ